MKTLSKLFISFIVLIALIGCNNDTIFTEYRSMPLSGWDVDSVLTFYVPVVDTLETYDIIVDVRHTTSYPYQNMWLFVNADTIDFYLANQRGEWLGNGRGELREMPVLYKQNVRFPSVDTCKYEIRQGMRSKNLKGVRDIGLIVNKHKSK